ncbi:FtsB family cell division protein [Albibacterium profundi]|uniref:Septum formation initiator family protein n=1 Tax=Albibacterium profundi TaxID=3134906 RepID=A0ABV5CC16_9SPHI
MHRLFKIIKNKYVIASFAFAAWMLFFDRNDLSSQYKYHSQLQELESEKVFYSKEIEKVQKDLEGFDNDPKQLQKFAREKYFMKKDNEDVYVIIREQ